MVGRARRGGLLGGASALAAALVFMGVPAAAAQDIGWASVADIDNYAWIDRADSMNEAIGESPPDFAFTYDGQEVWAWTLGDGSALIVEQQWDGPRSYYFDAGNDAPFLVRRAASDAPGTQGEVEVAGPQLSFGYARGAVAIVYTDDGGVLRPEHAGMYTGEALADWERGRQLRRAMGNRPVRRDVSVSLWFDFGTYWFDWNRRWDEGKHRHPGWWKHRNRPDWVRWHHRYDGERQRRRDQTERFRRWREGGFQGRPPGRYRPPSGDWTGGRPRGGFADGVMGTRPRPNPPGQGNGTGSANPRGPRGDGSWGGRPRPGAAVPAPAPVPGAVIAPPTPPVPPAPVVGRPDRPDRPTRPGWGGNRPRPVPMPVPNVVAPPSPPAPSVGRPERPDRPAYFPRGERPVRVAPNPGGNAGGRSSFTPPAPAPRSFTPPPAPVYRAPPPPPAAVYRAPPPPPPPAAVYRAPPPPPPATPRVERSVDNR